MSYIYGQPQRWPGPVHNSSARQVTAFANTMAASAPSARDDKKKTKDKNSKDKSIKLLGTKPAEELEEDIKSNDMSPTIKYAEQSFTAAPTRA